MAGDEKQVNSDGRRGEVCNTGLCGSLCAWRSGAAVYEESWEVLVAPWRKCPAFATHLAVYFFDKGPHVEERIAEACTVPVRKGLEGLEWQFVGMVLFEALSYGEADLLLGCHKGVYGGWFATVVGV